MKTVLPQCVASVQLVPSRQLEILGVIIDYSYCDVLVNGRSEPGGQQKSNQC